MKLLAQTSTVNNLDTPVFDGPGLSGGINATSSLASSGLVVGDVRTSIIRVIETVLSFLSLVAVIMIIIAGLYLVLSFGSDDAKDKAKKIILYTLIGLVIILFARVIVGLVTVYLVGEFSV